MAQWAVTQQTADNVTHGNIVNAEDGNAAIDAARAQLAAEGWGGPFRVIASTER